WFEDVTDAVGLNFTHDCGPTGTYFMPQSMYGGGALFDADGDGRLDILLLQGAGPNTGVGNRLYLQTADGKFRDASAGSGLDGAREFCGPRTFPGTIPRLFHNLGPGDGKPVRFADVTVPAGLATKAAPGLGVYAADMTGDGWPDLFVANDGTPNHLWVNQRDGTFKNEAMSRGLALTGNGLPFA